MKQIIPFSKDLLFTTKISEITSISLEHNLKFEENDYITGEMLISGDYKITDASINRENFIFNIPFEINLDKKYNLNNVVIDIDDFYYEIINDEVLRINIDVLVDGIEMLDEIIEEEVEELELVRDDSLEDLEDEFVEVDEEDLERKDIMEESLVEVDVREESSDTEVFQEKEENPVAVDKPAIDSEKIRSLFDSFDDKDETFSTYHVYIVRKEDTVESIVTKYGVTKEDLIVYNNLEELKLGDKIIIPKIRNE